MNNDNAMPIFSYQLMRMQCLKVQLLMVYIYMIVVTCKEVVPGKFTSMDTLFITLCKENGISSCYFLLSYL